MSNIQKLREFIKQVYVDRRYTGENHPVLHPRIRNSDKDESCEWTRQDSLRERGSDGHRRYAIDEPRSPGYPRETDDRYCRYSNNEVRSPGYSRENSRHAGLRASSSRFEGTDGSYQVDDARIAGRSATHMFTTEDIKPRRKSPPPPVRDVRAVLGDKFVSLRVGDQTKKSVFGPTNGEVRDHGGQNSPRETGDQSKTAHKRTVSAYVQNTVQPGNKTLVINSSLKPKRGSEGSLIDFASFPPPPPPPEASTQNQELQMQVSEPSLKKQLCNVPPPPKNTLEFLLFELSAPAEIPPSDQSGPQTCEDTASIVPSRNFSTLHDVPAEPNNRNDSSTLHLALASTQEFLNTPNASTDIPQSRHAEEPKVATPQMVPDFLSEDSVSFNETSKDQAPSNDQLGNSCTSGLDNSSAAPQPSHLHENSNHKEATLFPAASAEFAVANSTTQSLLSAKTPSHETNATVRSNARAELPEDLFASLYPSRTMSTPGWQMSPSYGMEFNMEYYQNAPMQTPPFSNVAKSVNPFDTNDDEAQPQLNTISSMPILHGGLAPAGILRTQSFETHLQRFSSAQLPSFQPGGYMAPFPSICIQPSRQQEIGGFHSGVATGPIYLNQHPHQNQASADLRPFPTNPFG